MPRAATNSFKKMMVFRTAKLSTISFPCLKKFLREDYIQKQLAQKFWYIKQYQILEKKKYNYLNRTSIIF